MKPSWKPQNIFSIQVLQISKCTIGPSWNATNVCSSFWRLYVNNSDGAWIQLQDGQHYPLKARRVYLIPAWVWFTCHNDRILDNFHIHFDLANLPGILIRQLFAQPLQLKATHESNLLLRSLKTQPWLQTQDTLAIECRIQALLHLVIAQAWESLSPQQLDTCRTYLQGTHRFAELLQYIEEHLSHALHNAELAGRCHLSRDHFVRRFSQEIDQTPANYIRERRVAKAAQLLRFGEASIEQIAQQCGFSDRFHFSRVFTHIMGSPPAAYRQGQHV